MESAPHPEHPLTDRLEQQYSDERRLNSRIFLHQQFSVNRYGWSRWVFDRVVASPSGNILEVGCGLGDLWFDNRDRIPSDWKIVLSDRFSGMVEAARIRLEPVIFAISFVVADIGSLPYVDDQFDTVIANHMLYHVPDISLALREVRRVMRPGGRFIATTNGRGHLHELKELTRSNPADDAPESDADRFGLENGGRLLSRWFGEVSGDTYSDELRVTDVEPLLAYITTMMTVDQLPDLEMDRIRQTISEGIERDGYFRVTKSSGIFVCRNV